MSAQREGGEREGVREGGERERVVTAADYTGIALLLTSQVSQFTVLILLGEWREGEEREREE